DADAALRGDRFDLRSEHEIIDESEDHTDMLMDVRAVGPFFKNGFVVGCEQTREAVLIDPGDEVADLLSAAEQKSLAIRHILLTHAHIDQDRKSTRLNSSHVSISYAVF